MDDHTRLRRKDTIKGPPLRILSLDGGGVRGYSMLIILQELMHKTFVEIEGRAPKRHEIPKPCDHFDLIAGTGTGGLIAIMLGRLRLDLDTCKDVYVRMTRRVFETDKTFAGIPYKSTMFKASKLEEAIKECVREHTIFEDEGNDVLANATPMSPETPTSAATLASSTMPQRTMSQSSRYSQMGMSPISQRMGLGSLRFGNANALLYDTRENRTKTAVTAVLKGTSQTAILRSYDSRREPAPDVNCTIWQAGRATSASAMAFKPIQIGQSVYLDEGAGKYNPTPQVLDEAVQSEWPGREVGVLVSIGTGKRPSGMNNNQQEWWEGFLGGSMGDFAEARRRLISKLEGCEETHRFMLQNHLSARGVDDQNYYRLNVEVGVGEFGMNEWARLSDISTSTRMYLSKRDIEVMNSGAASKMAKIHFAKIRHDRAEARKDSRQGQHAPQDGWQNPWDRPPPATTSPATAVELPGNDVYPADQVLRPTSGQYEHRPSIADQKYIVVDDVGQPPQTPPKMPARPYNQTYQQTSPGLHSPAYHSPRVSQESYHQESPQGSGSSAPPLPPKTPLPYPDQQASASSMWQRHSGDGPRTFMNMGDLGRRLPYPDQQFEDPDRPPPPVNTANKPSLSP